VWHARERVCVCVCLCVFWTFARRLCNMYKHERKYPCNWINYHRKHSSTSETLLQCLYRARSVGGLWKFKLPITLITILLIFRKIKNYAHDNIRFVTNHRSNVQYYNDVQVDMTDYPRNNYYYWRPTLCFRKKI